MFRRNRIVYGNDGEYTITEFAMLHHKTSDLPLIQAQIKIRVIQEMKVDCN